MRPSDCRTNNGSKAKEQYLSRVSILRSQSKRRSISVYVNKPIRAPKKVASEKDYYKTKHLIKHLKLTLTHDGHCGHACTTIWYAEPGVPNRIQSPQGWSRILSALKLLSCRTKKQNLADYALDEVEILHVHGNMDRAFIYNIISILYIYLRKKDLVYKEPENTRTAMEDYFACP